MRIRLVIPAALLVAAAYVKGRQDAVFVARPSAAPRCELPDDVLRRAEAEAADVMELTGERVVARAEAEVAATAPAFPAPPETDPWAIPEFPFAARGHATGHRRRGARPPASSPRQVVAQASPAEAAGPDLATLAEWATTPARPAAPAPAARSDEAAALSEWATHVAVVHARPPAAATPEARLEAGGRFSFGGWAAQAGHMAFCGVTFRDRLDRVVDPADIRLVPDALANVAEGGLVVLSDPGFAPDREGFTLVVAAAGPGSFAATGRFEVLAP